MAVVLDKSAYLNEATRHLDDTKTYKELNRSEVDTALQFIREAIASITERLCTQGNVTRTELNRLKNEESRIPPIYFLPKVHKPKNPISKTFAARPIIGAVGNILKPLNLLLTRLTAPPSPFNPWLSPGHNGPP